MPLCLIMANMSNGENKIYEAPALLSVPSLLVTLEIWVTWGWEHTGHYVPCLERPGVSQGLFTTYWFLSAAVQACHF